MLKSLTPQAKIVVKTVITIIDKSKLLPNIELNISYILLPSNDAFPSSIDIKGMKIAMLINSAKLLNTIHATNKITCDFLLGFIKLNIL